MNNLASKISTPFHYFLDFHRKYIQAQHANRWDSYSVKECMTMDCSMELDALAEFRNEPEMIGNTIIHQTKAAKYTQCIINSYLD